MFLSSSFRPAALRGSGTCWTPIAHLSTLLPLTALGSLDTMGPFAALAPLTTLGPLTALRLLAPLRPLASVQTFPHCNRLRRMLCGLFHLAGALCFSGHERDKRHVMQRPPPDPLLTALSGTECDGCGSYVFQVVGVLEIFNDIQVFPIDTFPDGAFDVFLYFRQFHSHNHDFRFSFLE